MGCDIILEIVNPGASRVSFEDFESGEHDSTRRRGDGRENAIAAVGDVRRCSGNHIVISEGLRGHNPTECLDHWSGRPPQRDMYKDLEGACWKRCSLRLFRYKVRWHPFGKYWLGILSVCRRRVKDQDRQFGGVGKLLSIDRICIVQEIAIRSVHLGPSGVRR